MRKIWIGSTAILVVAAAIGAYAVGARESGIAAAPAGSRPAVANGAGDTVQLAQNAPRTVDGVKVRATDRVLGKPDAPVTIFEYASLTCPHCAHFHNTVLPEIKKAYVDVGTVRLVYRDYPLDRLAFAAAVIARCNEGDRYFSFLDALFRSQATWSRAKDPIQSLRNIARLGGIQPAKFDACLKDEARQKAVAEQRFDASRRLHINSTPSLIIDNKLYGGGMTFEQIKAIVDPLLPKS